MIDITRLPTIQEIKTTNSYLDFYLNDQFVLTVFNNIELSNILLWCAAKHYTSYDENGENPEFTQKNVYFISNNGVKYSPSLNFKYLILSDLAVDINKIFSIQISSLIGFRINNMKNDFEDGNDINLHNLNYET